MAVLGAVLLCVIGTIAFVDVMVAGVAGVVVAVIVVVVVAVSIVAVVIASVVVVVAVAVSLLLLLAGASTGRLAVSAPFPPQSGASLLVISKKKPSTGADPGT